MSKYFNGLLETDYCPVCKSINQMDYENHYVFDSDTKHYFMFASCHLCQKTFMYEYTVKKQDKLVRFTSPYSSIDVDFVYRYPANEATTYESVDPEIKKSYLEGVRCLNVNAPNAAVTMFRRTLQQVCKDKGTTKRDLKDQIDEIIPLELKTEAHELIFYLCLISAHWICLRYGN